LTFTGGTLTFISARAGAATEERASMRDDAQSFVETWGKRFTLPMGSLARARSQ
jgi:hypothetical protein